MVIDGAGVFHDLALGWLTNFNLVLEPTTEPKTGSLRKNLKEPDPGPPENFIHF